MIYLDRKRRAVYWSGMDLQPFSDGVLPHGEYFYKGEESV